MKYILASFILFLISFSSLSQPENIKFNANFTIDKSTGDVYVFGTSETGKFEIVQLNENLDFLNQNSFDFPPKFDNITVFASSIGTEIIIENKKDSNHIFLDSKLKLIDENEVNSYAKFFGTNTSFKTDNIVFLFLANSVTFNESINEMYKEMSPSEIKLLGQIMPTLTTKYNVYAKERQLVVFEFINDNWTIKDNFVIPSEVRTINCIGSYDQSEIQFIGSNNTQFHLETFNIETNIFTKKNTENFSSFETNQVANIQYDKYRKRYILHNSESTTSKDGTCLFSTVQLFDNNLNKIGKSIVHKEMKIGTSRVLTGKAGVPILIDNTTKITPEGIYIQELVSRSLSASTDISKPQQMVTEYINQYFIGEDVLFSNYSFSPSTEKSNFDPESQNKIASHYTDFILQNRQTYCISRDKLTTSKAVKKLYYIDFKNGSFNNTFEPTEVIGQDQFPYFVNYSWGRSKMIQSHDEKKVLWLKVEKVKIKLEPIEEFKISIQDLVAN